MRAQLTLDTGEQELRRWTISWKSFLIRTGVLMIITWIMLGPWLLGPDFIAVLFAGVLISVFYMWVFGDFRIWNDHRDTIWLLSERALYIHGPNASSPVDMRLPLSEIDKIRTWIPWALVLRLRNGTAISLPLVPSPRATASAIRAAKDAIQ